MFLSGYPEDAQLIYKATAHVDGEGKLGNGISRHIFSYLPIVLQDEEEDEDEDEDSEVDESDGY
jgi:hypothetical protein